MRLHCLGPNSVKFRWVVKELRRDKIVLGEISAIFGRKKVELKQMERTVTPFGGVVVLASFLKRVGFAEQVRGATPF